MSTSYELRKELIKIARRDINKVEVTKNQAPWIKKLWSFTDYGLQGYENREPYCSTGLCYCIAQWLMFDSVLKALKFSQFKAEKWRPKEAAVRFFERWARDNNILILPRKCILHLGDIVIYNYSHIELVTDDDNTETGPFVAIGYNTNESGSRDGTGCYEKPRSRKSVKCFIRILP